MSKNDLEAQFHEHFQASGLPTDAREFLIAVAEKPHEIAAVQIQLWLAEDNSMVELIRAARDMCPDEDEEGAVDEFPKVRELLNHIREALLGGIPTDVIDRAPVKDKFTYTDGSYFCNECDTPHEGDSLAEACFDSCTSS